jgi:acetolactate decarboxylase
MKRAGFIFLLLVIFALPVMAAGAADREVVYQTSTIDALLAGMYDGKVSLAELRQHGDIGLGTFDRLDGEMVMLEGNIYQITADGAVHLMRRGTTPFAAVTFFDKDQSAAIGREKSMAELTTYLDHIIATKSRFYAIRIDGTFKYIKARSVPAQSKPYPKLVEVTSHQPVFEFRYIKGTLVGLRCPYYVKGVNVPGYHFHFISADRKRGGHVLDCVIERGLATLDETSQFHLFLPKDAVFDSMDFESSAAPGDLKKVE